MQKPPAVRQTADKESRVLHRPKHNINTTIKRDIFRFDSAKTGDITTI